MADQVPTNGNVVTPVAAKPKCGIIMPISEIDGLSEKHWVEVLSILSAAIEDAGFEANLVSTTDEVGIIQQTIIQNLYDNPIIVCDVSAKNPNVMFELGMRLAFDKPTVIVKDDKTSYSFDTSPIQHLSYPRDLHYHQIVEFQTKLSAKIKNTYKRAQSDPEYTTFLKHFGEFVVAKIERKEVSSQEFIIEELKSIKRSMTRLERSSPGALPSSASNRYEFDLDVPYPDFMTIVESAVRHFPELRPDRGGGGKIVMSSAGDLPLAKLRKVQAYFDRKAAQYHDSKDGSQTGKTGREEVPVVIDDETAS
jgi:hypothetical protein